MLKNEVLWLHSIRLKQTADRSLFCNSEDDQCRTTQIVDKVSKINI